MTEWIVGAGLFGLLAYLAKLFFGRGGSQGDVGKQTEDLAAKRMELRRKKEELDDLDYASRKKALDEKEDKLRKRIKESDEVTIDETQVDDMGASELARRLNAHME